MALVDIHPDENGVVDVHGVAGLVLELGDVLVGVKWDDSVVVVCSGDQHGWVLLLSHVVERRVTDQEVVRSWLVWVPVFCLPEMTTCEFVEAEHVCDWHLWDRAGEEVRPLVGRDCDEGTSVGPTQRDQMLVVCEPMVL